MILPTTKSLKLEIENITCFACMEIFESEMEFSWENGSDELFDLLKEKKYYPYNDLNREPVA